ncbi:WD40-repeat-containing domain protein [Mycena rosella]|uniref:WD40-repeat-containing domain protein n=1 Tax=Mycena rosella TaxID=1033263 RepID=A0AAD7G5L2_MYCRO|nr:WD40-repeat-containing domain protein [Mycena rosella]
MSGPGNGLLFANFNQDYSCVSVGTRKGYSITNCDPFGRVYTQNDGARGIVEMLFCTSLIALVGAPALSSPSPTTPTTPAAHPSARTLQIVNTKRQSTICELLFPAPVLAVRLNRKTLAIVLETEIYVYDVGNMRLLHVCETQANPEAICALSPSAAAPYLAYPAPLPSPSLSSASASSTSGSTGEGTGGGDVMVFSTRALAPANALRAHRAPLALLSISASGGMLASASVKGTVIRVFALPSCERVYEFRRGARAARVWSLAFNGAGTLLAAGSDRGTVHVWRVGGAGSATARSSPSNSSPPSPSPSSPSNGTHPTNGNRRDDPSSALDAGYGAFVDGKRGAGGGGSLRRAFRLPAFSAAAAAVLPAGLTAMWAPARDFAWARLPEASTTGANERRCVVGLSSTTPHVMVLSSDGYFYAYSIDLERGGECVLVRQYSLLQSGEETGI